MKKENSESTVKHNLFHIILIITDPFILKVITLTKIYIVYGGDESHLQNYVYYT